MSRNLRGLSARRGLKEGLYEEVVKVAGAAHTSRDEVLTSLADDFMTGTAAALGVSSFYDFLDDGHYGKKVFVCDGTACLTSGRQAAVSYTHLTLPTNREV